MAWPVDLTAATDRSAGFAADGVAYIGEIVLSVMFSEPFPEDLHLKAFCDEAIRGVEPIKEKRVDFRFRADR